jgi:TRAP-type C4-dicarboxylate transport system permease small subunit
MKRVMCLILLVLFLGLATGTRAQCSICTKTAQQMGHKPAKGLNQGIVYLMVAPFAIMGVVGYRWWKSDRSA